MPLYDVRMRFVLGLWLLLILAFAAVAQNSAAPDSQNLQTAYCPQTHPLEVEPSQKFFLEGTVGKRRIRMYLDRGGSGVVGLFYDLDTWRVTEFGGTWNKGQIDASDEAESHPATGRLSASFAGKGFIGSWEPVNSKQAEPVNLASIPEPACDGKETWTAFHDSSSPISFSYPASWHVDRDQSDVWLTCPDASEIAYAQGVLITMGAGKFKGPPEILQCGGDWIYRQTGSKCDCVHRDDFGCHAAKAVRRGSAIVLDAGEHEWRNYCREGGYVGQGYGEDRIILLPHNWIEIMAQGKSSVLVDRFVDSVNERPAPPK